MLKRLALRSIENCGINQLFRFAMRRRLLGLCYHGVIGNGAPFDDLRTHLAVSQAQFEEQMNELRKQWKPVSLTQILNHVQHGKTLPDKAVFVSFDDGFANNLTYAAPILQKYQIPAAIFLTTGLLGTQQTVWALELLERIHDWEPPKFVLPKGVSLDGSSEIELPPTGSKERFDTAYSIFAQCRSLSEAKRKDYLQCLDKMQHWHPQEQWQKDLYRMLDWDEVEELYHQGIEFGIHTVSHCSLAQIDINEAVKEMEMAKAALRKRLKFEPFSIAYPFGDSDSYSEVIVKESAASGFRLGFTLSMRRNPEVLNPLLIDRICITGDLTLPSFQALISGLRNG